MGIVPYLECPLNWRRFSQLSKKRGGKQLFSGLYFDIHRGEIVGVAGDSGIGKSSLGDMLLDLLSPDGGTIDRNPSHADEPHKFLKIYQDPPANFAPHTSLGILFRDLMNLYRIENQALVDLLVQLRLNDGLLSRCAEEVSGGELQRLAIARALLVNPIFLFADEPSSRIDPITEKEVLSLLVNMARQADCALLLVSHNLPLLNKTCDRIIDLKVYSRDE